MVWMVWMVGLCRLVEDMIFCAHGVLEINCASASKRKLIIFFTPKSRA